jgi:hypothetical protein
MLFGVFLVSSVAAQTEPAGAVSLELVGQFGGASYAIEKQGDYIYLGVGPRLHILDVSEPERPLLIGRSEPLLLSFITDIVLTGDYALVMGYSGGLRVVDVSDPANPIELGAYDLPAGGENSSVAVTGRHAYVTTSGGLRVLDLANPAAPVEVASLSARRSRNGMGSRLRAARPIFPALTPSWYWTSPTRLGRSRSAGWKAAPS